MAFCDEIKSVRLSCLMSQIEFGESLGVSYTTISRWENGKETPNLKAMKSIKGFCKQHNLSYENIEKSWLDRKQED